MISNSEAQVCKQRTLGAIDSALARERWDVGKASQNRHLDKALKVWKGNESIPAWKSENGGCVWRRHIACGKLPMWVCRGGWK